MLLDRRRRRHLAVLSVVIMVSVFGYGLLQPRQVRVQADGREIVVRTTASSDDAVLSGAGIDLRAADRVTSLHGRDGDVVRVERAKHVVLAADGATYDLRTHALTIDQLMSEASVAVTGRDSVLQNGELVAMNAPLDPPQLLAVSGATGGAGGSSAAAVDAAIGVEVRRAVPFSIFEDGVETSTTSSRPTVAQALREAGKIIGPGDAVSPDPQAVLDADARVELRHARSLTVTLPTDRRVLYTFASTVGDALASAGVVIPAGAFIEPSAAAVVSDGMAVRVVQLSGSNDVTTEYIESKTVYRADPELAPGETRTVKGHDGARTRHYDISYVDGVEAGRELIDDRLDPTPVDTVIYYAVQQRAVEAAPAESGGATRSLRVYATWYSPASSGRAASDPDYGRTATGASVTYGIVAVDPAVIPLGTRMFIPGYGYAIAADTGGAVKGYTIDLGYPDGVRVDWLSKWVEIDILS